MKKAILTIFFATLLSISANAQVDSTKAENRFNQIEQQIQKLQETYNEAQSELQELSTSEVSLQSSFSRLSTSNEELLSRLDSLTTTLDQNTNQLGNLTRSLLNQTQEFQEEISASHKEIESLSQAITGLEQILDKQREELSNEITATKESTSQSVSELDDALSKNTLFWIIAVLAVGLLSMFSTVFLRKKVTDNQSSINDSLAKTRRDLEQEAIRLDEKLVGVMETQMKIIQEEREAKFGNRSKEQDHSLALKVADEIVRIEKNISRMDEETKGLKQLSKAVDRIKDNFASNGYEMVDMVGMSFDDGMKVTANFRPDENLNSGQRIITRIIKPQVNYQGEMIQSAQVEVSQGE